MPFRIRNTDTENQDEYESCEKAYSNHLESFKKTSNRDLWKFFAWDFFHDGRIDAIEFRPDLRTAKITLDCPNIRSYDETGAYKFVGIDFTCTFRNVVQFSILDSEPTEWADDSSRPAVFLHAEINTAIPDGLPRSEADHQDEFYSLVIEALGKDYPTWIELVFSQVDVTAKEPAAFAIMEADPRFHVPTYRPEV